MGSWSLVDKISGTWYAYIPLSDYVIINGYNFSSCIAQNKLLSSEQSGLF